MQSLQDTSNNKEREGEEEKEEAPELSLDSTSSSTCRVQQSSSSSSQQYYAEQDTSSNNYYDNNNNNNNAAVTHLENSTENAAVSVSAAVAAALSPSVVAAYSSAAVASTATASSATATTTTANNNRMPTTTRTLSSSSSVPVASSSHTTTLAPFRMKIHTNKSNHKHQRSSSSSSRKRKLALRQRSSSSSSSSESCSSSDSEDEIMMMDDSTTASSVQQQRHQQQHQPYLKLQPLGGICNSGVVLHSASASSSSSSAAAAAAAADASSSSNGSNNHGTTTTTSGPMLSRSFGSCSVVVGGTGGELGHSLEHDTTSGGGGGSSNSSSNTNAPQEPSATASAVTSMGQLQQNQPNSSSSEANNPGNNPTTTTPTPANNPNSSNSKQIINNRSGSPNSSTGAGAIHADLQQPDGWRVKLYRLNADGSWDDCGTGRIVCLYRPPPLSLTTANATAATTTTTTSSNEQQQRSSQLPQSQQQPNANDDEDGDGAQGTNSQQQDQPSSSSSSSPPSPNSNSNSDQWLYQETGEATLCVQAEVTKQNRQPRVLLRTRILLRDAYQRQGDNIITWCEPYYSSCNTNNPTSTTPTTTTTTTTTTTATQHQGSNTGAKDSASDDTTADNDTTAGSGSGSSSDDNENDGIRPTDGDRGISASSSTNQQNNNNSGVDLALSFQDNAGCLDIWRQITHVQGRASELLRRQQQQQIDKQGDNETITNTDANNSTASVEDMAARVAAQHHADLQRQQQHEFWSPSNSQHHNIHGGSADDHRHLMLRSGGGGGADEGSVVDVYISNNNILNLNNVNNNNNIPLLELPNPPTLQNLEDIADTIAALQHVQQRESLAMWIADGECAYLKALLALFPSAEVRGDYGNLATLAACVKTVLLLNDPSILELIVSVASIFEQVCSCLEYDPDLREKANHRWFLRERAKFRTVVPMEDPDLVEAIHRSFRVSYLRDTLLRPTMDESSLSTLSSLQTFTFADVVKGVTMAGNEPDGNLFDSYLIKVIDMLCVELHALSIAEWAELEAVVVPLAEKQMDDMLRADPSIVVGKHPIGMSTWKQYLAPQDGSLLSRRLRRHGCLSFLKELFNMVRLSLQQNDKDDFFSVICSLSIDLNDAGREIADNVSQSSQMVEVGSVASTIRSDRLDEKTELLPHPVIDSSTPPPPTSLLSMLGSVLADPNADVSEKGAVLEIIGGIVMHDPGLIRRHCLDYHSERKNRLASEQATGGREVSARPEPNEKNQVIFWCPTNDLMASLLFLLDVETDAGVLLQVSEIMRIILDTDMVSDHGPITLGFADEGIPLGNSGHLQPLDKPHGIGASSTEQKQFLSLFYEHYVEWLVAPFQFTILHPVRRVPDHLLLDTSDSPLLQRMIAAFQKGISPGDPQLKTVPACAVRCSFAVELLSFCVRAHLYRMKFFLLKSRVLGSVLKLLRRHPLGRGISGDRCLKLAALRFLRAILSVNDEFYHRHIIQHDLFGPVFEALRSNPVGDNLVSSAIVEMCDYIHSENIRSLIEYIVTRHLSTSHPENTGPSLEDVSSPYVSTLTVLRKAYEANLNASRKAQSQSEGMDNDRTCPSSPGGSRYHHSARQLTGRALEDQRKFQELDQEESYFDSNDDGGNGAQGRSFNSTAVHPAVDEIDSQQVVESELHRTPRMFSLAQAPLLNNLEETSVVPTGKTNASNDDDLPAPMEVDERETEAMALDSFGEGEEMLRT